MAYSIEGLEKSRGKGFRHKSILGMVLKNFLNLCDGYKILDIGCGTGFFTRILAEQVDADIIGIDINESLINGAAMISNKQNLSIKYEVGDINNIKYSDNTFDIVMCDIMLECFKDITIPLMEMKRVCKTGGIVVAIEPFYQSYFEYYPDTDNEMRDIIMKISRVDRAFGIGPMLPNLLKIIGLANIDLIGWFWGGIGNQTLAFETTEEKIADMAENLDAIKRHIVNSKYLSEYEQNCIIKYYESRLNRFIQNPLDLKQDMSVRGLPVFIVKGTKHDDTYV